MDYVDASYDRFLSLCDSVDFLNDASCIVIKNIKYNSVAYGSRYSDELHTLVDLIEQTKVCKSCDTERSHADFFFIKQPIVKMSVTEANKLFGQKKNVRVKCRHCRYRF